MSPRDKDTRPLGRALVNTLARRAESGDFTAKQALVTHNTRLVHKIVNEYPAIRGVEREDLVQEGMLGLVRAVEKFDYRRGFCISTLAKFYIRRRINLLLARNSVVYIPGTHAGLHRAIKELCDSSERRPSVQEMAEALGEDQDVILGVLQASGPLSLDNTYRDCDGESVALVDTIDSGKHHDEFSRSQLRVMLQAAATGLTEREREVLRRRFEDDATVRETAGAMNISIGLVHATQNSATSKLKIALEAPLAAAA